jgi:hypothetical protein
VDLTTSVQRDNLCLRFPNDGNCIAVYEHRQGAKPLSGGS